ncbi:MAG: hypothetical protein BMS9Abin12_2098 [Acidimicrobiia bacterium]|nr:MAG: hypothetical protein BMS9Abin12_2098 [Acidimicrobiia bacterium]
MRAFTRKLRRSVTDQTGAVLVLMSLSLVVLMAMAAFAVDYGWIAYNRLEVRKAAEAAALAGVVHMPLPGSTTFGAGAEPYDVALAVALQAGYNASSGSVVVTPAETSSPNQLRVTVSDQINTFFMKVFVPGPITVTGTALAEQLPPLKIGSDESHLGNTSLGGSDQFWVAINGRRDYKFYGDAYTTHCLGSQGCSGTPNPEHRNPGHYYAIEIPEGASGNVTVGIFDGTHKNRGLYTETGDVAADDEFKLRFKLYPPDSTPGNWTDNKANNGGVSICNRTFWNDGAHPTRPVGWGVNQWKNLTPSCGAAIPGIYVLEVSMADAGSARSNSSFSIRARVGGADGVAAVYGLGSMTLYMNAASSEPEFKIVRLDEIYAGSELVLSLFDVGDIGGDGDIVFTNAFAGIDCEVQIRRDSGSTGVTPYKPDDQYSGGLGAGTCGIDISNKKYNGDWLDFKFDIPPDYTCSGQGCWGKVKLMLDDSPFDTTSWAASINGTPVHLEP